MSVADGLPVSLLAPAHLEQATVLAATFKLLGDPTRLRIVLRCLDAPRSVGDVALELGLSQSLVSQHLRLLRSARLVVGIRKAKRVSYEVSDDHIRTVLVQIIVHVSEAVVDTEG